MLPDPENLLQDLKRQVRSGKIGRSATRYPVCHSLIGAIASSHQKLT